MSSELTIHMQEEHHAHPQQRLSALGWLSIAIGALCVGLLIYLSLTHHDPEPMGEPHGHAPRLWGIGILPFVGILGSIAFLPLIPATQHWWESNRNRLLVSLICAGATLVYVIAIQGIERVPIVLEHAIVIEYIPFIVLLFSLYVISGGIRLTGDLKAKPLTNTGFLAVGAGLASFIGTTGASMLLIRPLLQTNSERKHVLHTVVFFIFLVSNIGGTLLPIGDPPLFLGYLRGVEFFWTLNLTVEWAFCCAILLVVYYVWDRRAYSQEDISSIQRDVLIRKPLRMQGAVNILWLAGVVLSVAFITHEKPFPGTGWTPFVFMREILMLAFVAMSLLTTPRGVREANFFNYHAILEVGALFVGIFIAMQIPLEVLHAKGAEITAVMSEPWQFFWATGGLSSFLDNAPTYVVFFELSKTMHAPEGTEMYTLMSGGELPVALLVAISLGAVFMGAMTYIGNGPNFMVKSIAEQSGVKMPSFFGYMIKFSIPILVPVFILVTLIFLI